MSNSPEYPQLAAQLIHARRTTLPKRLIAPGPNSEELQQILGAAAAAPDHDQLLPWRFVMVPATARAALGQAFADALLERDPAAMPDQIEQAREKAFRAPVLMLAVVDSQCGDASIDLHERTVSLGCAIQNMLLMATALGFGSALTSGKALKSHALRDLFGLASTELAICFVSVGSVSSTRLAKARPATSRYVSTLNF